jgi:hypothetical protein
MLYHPTSFLSSQNVFASFLGRFLLEGSVSESNLTLRKKKATYKKQRKKQHWQNGPQAEGNYIT